MKHPKDVNQSSNSSTTHDKNLISLIPTRNCNGDELSEPDYLSKNDVMDVYSNGWSINDHSAEFSVHNFGPTWNQWDFGNEDSIPEFRAVEKEIGLKRDSIVIGKQMRMETVYGAFTLFWDTVIMSAFIMT